MVAALWWRLKSLILWRDVGIEEDFWQIPAGFRRVKDSCFSRGGWFCCWTHWEEMRSFRATLPTQRGSVPEELWQRSLQEFSLLVREHHLYPSWSSYIPSAYREIPLHYSVMYESYDLETRTLPWFKVFHQSHAAPSAGYTRAEPVWPISFPSFTKPRIGLRVLPWLIVHHWRHEIARGGVGGLKWRTCHEKGVKEKHEEHTALCRCCV